MVKTIRTIEFLERTAKAMPNKDVRYSGVMVCFVSLSGVFNYFRAFEGGSLHGVTRSVAAYEFERNQRAANKA